jgi:RNA polymerase sigma-70 factor (ECF subfamily)
VRFGLTEQQMVDGVLTGDKSAFQELYRTYKKEILHTCWCFLGNDAEVEAAAKETFARAIRQMGRFKFQCSLGAWLDHLAATHCREILEKNKKRLLYSVDFFVQPDKTGVKPRYPEETLKLLREEIELLEGADKELLTLREYKGWPYEAVANKMKMPVGAAAYAIFRIRQEMMEKVRARLTPVSEKAL